MKFFGDYMWWQIIKIDYPPVSIHIDDLVTDELRDNAKQLGIENLDIRIKDRLVGASVPVGNDGIITDKEFFGWVEDNPEYLLNMTPEYQQKLKRYVKWHNDGDMGTFETEIIEALNTIIEIEDGKKKPLEARTLFGMGCRDSIHHHRNILINDERSQRTQPEEDET